MLAATFTAVRWPYHNPAPKPRCAARVPRSVGRYSKMRYARGTRVTGFKRADHDFSKLSLPTGGVVGAAEPRPTAWVGARRALAHNTTTSTPRGVARALRDVGRYSMVRYARGTRVI